MKLYGLLASNNVRKPYAVAQHLGLEIELVDVAPMSPAADNPTFRAASPAGRIPALVDGDFKLNESNAIMLYFSSLKPGVLMPTEVKAQALVHQWMAWSLAHWYRGWQPLQFENLVKQLYGRGDPDPAIIQMATDAFHREAKILDAHLASRQWLVGEAVTLADYAVAAGLSYRDAAKIPVSGYAHILAWYARVDALPAWQKSAPPPR
jgi:glutathione S-transferase